MHGYPSDYPEVVAKICSDYLDRVKSRLLLVPALEQAEFLREIRPHIYEAYREMPGDDEVSRILAVLRNFGDPAEVVADGLPETLVRSGTKRNLPLYITAGILIALFGIPLGFGGFGVLAGLMVALAGILLAYYAVTASILLTGAILALSGLTQFFVPELWDKLLASGFVTINGPPAEFLDSFPVSDRGLIMLALAGVFIASGWGLLRLGRSLLRGSRFLLSLIFDWSRRCAQSVRRKMRQNKEEALPHSQVSFLK